MDVSSFIDNALGVTPKKQPYDDLIEDSASRHDVDPDFIRAVMDTESAFDPNAKSPKNARGLMQLIPGTAHRMGVKNIYDPKENIEGGTKYLKQLLDMFDGDVSLALAGYNAGEGAVQKYGNKIPPYKETRNYVKKITGNYQGSGYHPTKIANSFIDGVLGGNTADPTNNFIDQVLQPSNTEDEGMIYGQPASAFDSKGGVATSPTFATPQPPQTVPESPDALQAQIISTFDVNSPKSMTLLPKGNPSNNYFLSTSEAKRLTRVDTPDGVVLVNTKKLGIKPSQAQEYVKKNGFAKDAGFVIDMGNNTGDGQPAIAAIDPNTGKEVFAAVTPDPVSAQIQAQKNAAMFPGTLQVPTNTDEVAAKRWFNTQAEVDEYNRGVDEQNKALQVSSDLTNLGIIGESIKEGVSAKDALARQAEIQARFDAEKAKNPSLTAEEFNARLASEGKTARTQPRTGAPQTAQISTGLVEDSSTVPQIDPTSPISDDDAVKITDVPDGVGADPNGIAGEIRYSPAPKGADPVEWAKDDIAQGLSTKFGISFQVARQWIEKNGIGTDPRQGNVKNLNPAQIAEKVKNRDAFYLQNKDLNNLLMATKIESIYAEGRKKGLRPSEAYKGLLGQGLMDDVRVNEIVAESEAQERDLLVELRDQEQAKAIASVRGDAIAYPEGKAFRSLDTESTAGTLTQGDQEAIYKAADEQLNKILAEYGTVDAYRTSRAMAQSKLQAIKDERQKLVEMGVPQYTVPLQVVSNAFQAGSQVVTDLVAFKDIFDEFMGIPTFEDMIHNVKTAEGRLTPAAKRMLYKASEDSQKWIENNSYNDDLLNTSAFLNDIPKAVTQMVMQVAAGAVTGTAGAGALMGAAQGVKERYKEAYEGGATPNQRRLIVATAAAAAIPEYFITKGILARAKLVDASKIADKFFSNTANQLFAQFRGEVGEAEARELTRAALSGLASKWPRFSEIVKTAGKGAAGLLKPGAEEAVQEVWLEDKVNNAVAYATYDKSQTRWNQVQFLTNNDVKTMGVSAVAGSAGGALGTALGRLANGTNKILINGKEFDTPTAAKPLLNQAMAQYDTALQTWASAKELYEQGRKQPTQEARREWRQAARNAYTQGVREFNLAEQIYNDAQEVAGGKPSATPLAPVQVESVQRRDRKERAPKPPVEEVLASEGRVPSETTKYTEIDSVQNPLGKEKPEDAQAKAEREALVKTITADIGKMDAWIELAESEDAGSDPELVQWAKDNDLLKGSIGDLLDALELERDSLQGKLREATKVAEPVATEPVAETKPASPPIITDFDEMYDPEAKPEQLPGAPDKPQLPANNPYRADTADPEMVKRAQSDSKAQKVLGVLEGKTLGIDEIGKAAKIATTRLDRNLDGAGDGDTKNKGTANIPVAATAAADDVVDEPVSEKPKTPSTQTKEVSPKSIDTSTETPSPIRERAKQKADELVGDDDLLSNKESEQTSAVGAKGELEKDLQSNKADAKKPQSLSNTQIEFSPEQAKPFDDFRKNVIDLKDVADKSVLPEYAKDGIFEIEPHVTVKYGLHTNKHDEVAPLLKGEKPIEVELGKTSVFKGSDKKIPGTDKPVPYDVVIVEVKSPDLERLNKKLTDGSENTTTFPYSPHATLAYVKSGEGEKYAGKTDFEGQKFTFDGVTFSPADKSGKQVIPLTSQKSSAKPDIPTLKALRKLGYSLPFAKSLTDAERTRILDEGIEKKDYKVDKPNKRLTRAQKYDADRQEVIEKLRNTDFDGKDEVYISAQMRGSNGSLINTSTVVKEAGLEDGSSLNKYRKAKSEPLKAVPDIIDSKGSIDYGTAQNVAGRIERGEATLERLDADGERGRIAGGRRAIEATLILAANERASEESGSRTRPVERQERALEEYAKREGIWIAPRESGLALIGKGEEARVYGVAGGQSVQKVIDYKQINKNATPLDFIDNRIAAFNQIFPDTPYELVGFTRTKDGFRFVVNQPFIQDTAYSTAAERQAFMKSKGFEMVDRYGEEFANRFYHVRDLHEKNALVKPDGTILVIDAVTTAKPIGNYEVVEKGEPLRSTPPFYSRVESLIADKMPNKATPDQVTALLLKNSTKELDPEFVALKVWLDDQGGSVAKADVAEFVKANRNVVGEVAKGGEEDNSAQIRKELTRDSDGNVLRNGKPTRYAIELEGDNDWVILRENEPVGSTKNSESEALDNVAGRLAERGDTTKFAQWQLPGESENYREEFLTAPVDRAEYSYEVRKMSDERMGDYYTVWNTTTDENAGWGFPKRDKASMTELAEKLNTQAKGYAHTQNTWQDGHSEYSDVVNPIARTRYNDRTTTDGDKMLFAEEFQQPGKGNFEKMPKVYQKYGEQMAIRKMLWRAVEGGYDYFGFTTGDQQADRYDLSKQVKAIKWLPSEAIADTTVVRIFPNEGKAIAFTVGKDGKVTSSFQADARQFEGKDLADVVGKDAAEKITQSTEGRLEGLDLKVGGEGLINRYDRKHVDYINKLMKPYGVQIEAKEIETSDGKPNVTKWTDLRIDDSGTEYELLATNKETGDKNITLGYFETRPEAEAELARYSTKPTTETVHAVRISPEFKAAVEQSIRDNGGAFPLLKVRTAEDSAELAKLAKSKNFSTDIVPHLKTKVKDGVFGKSILALDNNQTVEFARSLLAFASDVSRDEMTQIDGLFLDPQQVANIRDAALGVQDAFAAKGKDTKPIEAFVKALDKAASVNGTVQLEAFENAREHETGHAASYLGAKEKELVKRRSGLKELADSDPSFSGAFNKWAKIEGRNWKADTATPTQLAHGAEEVATYIADGQHARLGLSYQKGLALGVELQLRYAQARIDEGAANIAEALSIFDNTIFEQYKEAINEREQSNKSNESNGESSRTRQDNEYKGRDPGAEKENGTGDAQDDTGKQKAKRLDGRRPGKSGLPFDEKEAREADAQGRKVAAISRIIGVEIYYDPQTNAETAVRAEQLTGRVGVQKAIQDALTGKPSAEGMKVVYNEFSRLNALYDHFNENGQESEAIAIATELADLANAIQERQLATGQEAQIARTFDVLSPDIALLMAQRRIINKRGEGAKLTPEETASTIDAAKQLSKIEAQLEETRRKLRNSEAARRRLESDKEPRKRAATSQEKLLKEYQEQKTDLFAQLEKLFPDSPLFNGKEAALRMVVASEAEDFAHSLKHLLGEPNKGLTGMIFGDEQVTKTVPNAFTYTTRGTNKNTYQVDVEVLKGEGGTTRYIARDGDLIVAAAHVDSDHQLTGIITEPGMQKVGLGTNLLKEIQKLDSQLTTVGVASKQGQRVLERAGMGDEVLRSTPPEPLDPLKQEVLTKWTTGQILEGLPYEALIKTLEQFGISRVEAQQIHSDAVDVIRPAREPRTAEAKEKTAIRNEHYREAKKFGGKPALSGIAQDAQKDAKYKDDPKLIEVIDYLTNVNTAKAGRSLNQLINGIREANPEMSISDAERLAGRAQQAVNDLRAKRKRAADKAKNISEDARAEINRLTVQKRNASRRMSDHLKQLGRGTEWAMHRFNNLMRAVFVNNWVTQIFNAVQSTAVATPTQIALDGITQLMLRGGVNIGENTEINFKDLVLPEAYIFANNKQLAEQALAHFPEEYFRIHAGILGDIEIDKVAQADTAPKATKWLHTLLDYGDKATDVLSKVSLSKVQEMHFRNAIIASRFDQLIRAKSKGTETLESALKNGEFTKLVTEKDATKIADDALEVTFASEINDPIGKKLKSAYDVFDNFVPIFLNPVTYARFTYTTTKVMVANPLLFGAMDAKAAGGRGYNTKSVAKGVLAWSGVAVAYALQSALGGDDDRWDTLYIFGKDKPPLSIKRFFPLSAYFYVAHLIRQYKEGGTPPTKEDLLEGFMSLETEYYTYGPGMELAGAVKRYADGTGSGDEVGRASARMMGNFFGGLLSVLKPAKLALSAIDDEEATLRDDSDTAKEKFINEISRSVPGIIRLSDAPKKIDPVTDKPILQPWILGRAVGLNFVHPSFLSNKDSAATQWANRLFAYEGGSSKMSAEDRNAYFIKKRLKEAMRRGEIDLTTANEKAQKYLAKVLTPESMGRLKKELEMSELQSKIKAGFSQPDDPKKAAKELRDLRVVWDKATDQEKEDIRKVLSTKQNLSPEFIEEFGVTTKGQAKMNKMPDNLKTTFEKLGIKPPGFGDSLTPTKGGEKVKLTPEQLAKYERETLERIDKKVASLQSKPAYQNADDALKKKMVEGVIRKQRAEESAETKKEMKKLTDRPDSIIPSYESLYTPRLGASRVFGRQSENVIDRRAGSALDNFTKAVQGDDIDAIGTAITEFKRSRPTQAEKAEVKKSIREQIDEARYVLKNTKSKQSRDVLRTLMRYQQQVN